MQLSVQIEISFFKPSYNINIQIYRTNWLRYKQWWEFRSGRNQQFRRVMHRTIYSSTSAKPRRWLLIFFFWERERRRQRRTPLSASGGAGEILEVRGHHTSPPWKKNRKKLYYFYHSAWFITAQDRKLCKWVIKTAQMIIGAHLTSISDNEEVRRLHRTQRKNTKRQNPPQPQSVHPAAFWPEIQEYSLLYHQTTSFLHLSSS